MATQLALDHMPVTRRIASLRWLGEAASATERIARQHDIARALEATLIRMLDLMLRHKDEDVKPIVVRLFVPLFDTDLVNATDTTVRRLTGFIAELTNEARGMRHFSGSRPDGTPVDIAVSEVEIEEEAARSARGLVKPDLVTRARIAVSLFRTVDGLDRPVRIPVSVPFIHLLLLDDRDVTSRCLGALTSYFSEVDPPLATAIQHANHDLQSDDPPHRRDALKGVTLAYLQSLAFAVRTDLTAGFKRLSECSSADFSAFLDIDIRGASAEDGVPLISPRHGLKLLSLAGAVCLLTLDYNEMRSTAQALQAAMGDDPIRQKNTLINLIREVESSTDLFASAWALFLALFVGLRDGQTIFSVDTSVALSEWARRYLVTILSASAKNTATDEHNIRREEALHRERLCRRVHAGILRLSMVAAASERHVADLRQRARTDDELVGAWLFLGLIVAARVLPVIEEDWEGGVDEAEATVGRAVEQLAADVNPEFFPDVLNPFLYGPEQYDHATAAVLTILLASWNDLCVADSPLPIWWSADVAQLLEDLREKPETSAETQLKTDRDGRKPNRLGIVLTRTVPELAAALLDRAAPSS